MGVELNVVKSTVVPRHWWLVFLGRMESGIGCRVGRCQVYSSAETWMVGVAGEDGVWRWV